MNLFRKSNLHLKPLDQCSREENEYGESEYDAMIALSRLPEEFTGEQFTAEIEQVIANRVLSDLVDKGVVELVWDNEKQDFVFIPKPGLEAK